MTALEKLQEREVLAILDSAQGQTYGSRTKCNHCCEKPKVMYFWRQEKENRYLKIYRCTAHQALNREGLRNWYDLETGEML